MTDESVMTAPMRLEIRRVLNGSIDRVWEYLTDGDLRQKWFCGGSTSTEVGGPLVLSFDHSRLSREAPPERHAGGADVKTSGTILAYEKPTCLKFSWDDAHSEGETTVTINLRDLGEKTELHLIHEDLMPSVQAGVQAGWHAHLDLLVDLFNDLPARDFWIHYNRLEAHYEAAQAGG